MFLHLKIFRILWSIKNVKQLCSWEIEIFVTVIILLLLIILKHPGWMNPFTPESLITHADPLTWVCFLLPLVRINWVRSSDVDTSSLSNEPLAQMIYVYIIFCFFLIFSVNIDKYSDYIVKFLILEKSNLILKFVLEHLFCLLNSIMMVLFAIYWVMGATIVARRDTALIWS